MNFDPQLLLYVCTVAAGCVILVMIALLLHTRRKLLKTLQRMQHDLDAEPVAAALRSESRLVCGLLLRRLLLELEHFPVGGSCTLFTLLQFSFW